MHTTRRFHDGQSRLDQVFVFGSNLNGHHAGGAARFAFEERDAKWYIGQGPTGNAYALPTMSKIGISLTTDEVKAAVTMFKAWARAHDDLEFFVTPVGCGIAGFRHEDIAPMFRDAPLNCILPPEWEELV